MKQNIKFKSLPRFWIKEKDGRKPNTVRLIPDNDFRFVRLRRESNMIIEIENTETKEIFKRVITDYSEFGELGIISWRHED